MVIMVMVIQGYAFVEALPYCAFRMHVFCACNIDLEKGIKVVFYFFTMMTPQHERSCLEPTTTKSKPKIST